MNTRKQLFLHHRWLPSIVITLVALVVSVGCNWWVAPQIDKMHHDYGQNIAELAASRAFEPSLEQDLVSLQVIVQDVVAAPTIINATIHDVENNLLVQAGKRSLNVTQSQVQIVTTPITAHDSVTGYISISINSNQLFFTLSFALATAIVAAVAIGLMLLQRSVQTTPPPSTSSKPSTATHSATIPIVNVEPEPTASTNDAVTETGALGGAGREPQVELFIYFHNLRQLHGQLNHSSLRTVTERFEIHLRDIMTLYSGKLASINADYACLQFTNTASVEAVFSALCSGHLLLELNKQLSQFQLHFSCLVVPRDSATKQLRNLPYNLLSFDEWLTLLHNTAAGSLLIDDSLLAEDLNLAPRLHSNELTHHADVSVVTGFTSPYCMLLDKQLSQLRKHTN
ncbi:hypothetical protein [Aurantivibrio plasticivorans]